MLCDECGMVARGTKELSKQSCLGCGSEMRPQADDFFIRGAKGIIRESREAQAAMARLVEDVMEVGGTAAIEAPVGTGKTFAYMLPALISKSKRIVIATAKKSLQDQIGAKDGPFLLAGLESSDKVALRKGKNAYACRALVSKVFPLDDGKDMPPKAKTAEGRRFWDWLNASPHGELTEYPDDKPKFWNDIAATDCIGKACKFYSNCGYIRAKAAAANARVVVTNHHLLGFDLALGGGKLLGEYDTLVIDEAHQFEAAIRAAHTDELNKHAWTNVLQFTHSTEKKFSEGKAVAERWDEMYGKINGQNGSLPPDPFGEDGKWMIKKLGDFKKELVEWRKDWGFAPKETQKELKDGYKEIGASTRGVEELKLSNIVQELLNDIKDPIDRERVEATLRSEEAATRLQATLTRIGAPTANDVIYAETRTGASGQSFTRLVIAPVDVAPLLGPKLLGIPTVVLTSGTITVDNDFTEFRRRLGLDWKVSKEEMATLKMNAILNEQSIPEQRRVEELVLQSPFNYSKQAVLYVPKHLPQSVSGEDWPGSPRALYLDALTKEIMQLVGYARGNAFVLFTATSDMKAVQERLAMWDNRGFTYFMQADNPGMTLEQFRQTPNSVVLGLKSFWEGVDVQGDKLRLVIITKLPFPAVNDPLLQAKERVLRQEMIEQKVDPAEFVGRIFRTLQVPPMIQDLRQGAGRLIRSQTDRGVCAVLDPRIWTGSGKYLPSSTQTEYRGYGLTAVKSLGFSNRTSQISVIKQFLDFIAQGQGK